MRNLNHLLPICNFFKDKKLDAEDYEIVVALLALVKDEKIKENDILPILEYVFEYDMVKILNGLNRAKVIVDDKLIEKVLEEVKLDW